MQNSLLAALMAVCLATAMARCPSLKESPPVTVSKSGQVIQNLYIKATGRTPGITCTDKNNVVIQNVMITHTAQGDGTRTNRLAGSQGINFKGCNNIKIRNVRVALVGHPTGPLPNYMNFNIAGQSSTGVVIKNVIVSGGSSGVWLGDCMKPRVTNWAAYNVQGPFPRGQCIQLATCTGGIVENFICKNQWNYAWPEDAMSMWRSANSTVRNGVILGNNAPTGVALMFEQSIKLDNSWALAENVQVAYTGSGFSTYGGTHVNFKNTQIRDNHCDGKQGRKGSRSGGLMYYAGAEDTSGSMTASSDIECNNCQWYNTCDLNSVGKPVVMWWNHKENPNAWTKKDLKEVDFTLDEHPIKLELCFMTSGSKYVASTKTNLNVGLYGDGSVAAAPGAGAYEDKYEDELAVDTVNNPSMMLVAVTAIFGIAAFASIVAVVSKRMSRNNALYLQLNA